MNQNMIQLNLLLIRQIKIFNLLYIILLYQLFFNNLNLNKKNSQIHIINHI